MKKKLLVSMVFLSLLITTSCTVKITNYQPIKEENTHIEEKTEEYYRKSSFLKKYEEITLKNHTYLSSKGEQKILVIPVEFSDYPASKLKGGKEGSLTYIHNAFFGQSLSTDFESVAAYYNLSSYGQLKLQGKVTSWFTYPESFQEFNENSKENVKSRNILEAAVEWYRSTFDDLATFDQNKDGYIDAVYLIPSVPFDIEKKNNTLFWAHTYESTSTSHYSTKPYGRMYSWVNYNFLFQNKGRLPDTHVLIHETGHLLGLKDYYSEDEDEQYFATAKFDMMDMNIGDHNAFSKMLLDWTTPYVIQKPTTFKLHSFIKTGECIILTSSWNQTPMDEYLLLEFYTPTGINKKDVSGWVYSNLSSYGVKVYHIDARLGYITNFGNRTEAYVEDVEDTSILKQPLNTYHIDVAHNNTTSKTKKSTKGNYPAEPCYLIDFVRPSSFEKEGTAADESLLFKKDDSLDARLAYQEKPLFFHSNREINLSFSIKNITHDYAEIEFYEINA